MAEPVQRSGGLADRLLENLGAVLEVAEPAVARSGRREQHDPAGRRERAGQPDGGRQILGRLGGDARQPGQLGEDARAAVRQSDHGELTVGQKDPQRRAVEAAVGRLGLPREDLIMLGDTPYDVAAARRAGVPIVGLRSGGWDDTALAGARYVTEDAAALIDEWDRIFTRRSAA